MEDDSDYVTVPLNADTALSQAAQSLERAADIADKINDVQAMMKIAAGWMEMHEYLRGGQQAVRKPSFGFCGPNDEQEELLDAIGESVESDGGEYDEDDYPDEGESRSGVYPQHGQLRVNALRYRRRRFIT